MYSKKRLMVLGIVWVAAGAVAFGVSPQFGADAQDPRGCNSAPCAFPAENNIGGIILGTDKLAGDNLVSFGYDGTYTDETPPDRVEPDEQNIGLGVSGDPVQTGRFFIYKQWYYEDKRTQDEESVYVWANASNAELTAIGSSNTDCGIPNSDVDGPGASDGGWEQARTCHLLANASEISANYIYVEPTCLYGAFCFIVNGLDPFEINDYHAVRPEEDTCGAIGALSGTVCIGLIKNGGSDVLGTGAGASTVEAYDIIIRGHEFRAVNGPNNNNKRLTLNDAYIEMRYGKGGDRIYTPDSNPNVGSGNYPGTPGSNDNWGQPVTGPSGEAGIGVDHTCQGGGPNTFCAIPSGRVQDREGESYDNIY